MLALSIRQPYAELILRGIKTAELRSRSTKRIGERFYIYAAKKSAVGSGQSAVKIWSKDLRVPESELPEWMIELAEQMKMIEPGELFPTGVIVGSAVIERVEEVGGRQWAVGSNKDAASLGTHHSQVGTLFKWHLADVVRAKRLRKPQGHPQPVWFRPFE